MNDSPIYTKNEIDRPSNVSRESRSGKGSRAAAFDFEEVVLVDGEVDVGREDNSRDDEENVGDVESELFSESNVVEIELGCANSTEDGTGIEDVNSGTGFWNDPLIRSSLNWHLSESD
jgi:hypothetical protein